MRKQASSTDKERMHLLNAPMIFDKFWDSEITSRQRRHKVVNPTFENIDCPVSILPHYPIIIVWLSCVPLILSLIPYPTSSISLLFLFPGPPFVWRHSPLSMFPTFASALFFLLLLMVPLSFRYIFYLYFIPFPLPLSISLAFISLPTHRIFRESKALSHIGPLKYILFLLY